MITCKNCGKDFPMEDMEDNIQLCPECYDEYLCLAHVPPKLIGRYRSDAWDSCNRMTQFYEYAYLCQACGGEGEVMGGVTCPACDGLGTIYEWH